MKTDSKQVMQATIDELIREVKELQDKASLIACAFCGNEQLKSEFPAAMAKHIVECDKHPMRSAVKENIELKAAVNMLLSALCPFAEQAAIIDAQKDEKSVDLLPFRFRGSICAITVGDVRLARSVVQTMAPWWNKTSQSAKPDLTS